MERARPSADHAGRRIDLPGARVADRTAAASWPAADGHGDFGERLCKRLDARLRSGRPNLPRRPGGPGRSGHAVGDRLAAGNLPAGHIDRDPLRRP